MEKQKVALVLSGGGARGVAHFGVIEELEKNGFEITSVAGTSMGALIGGIFVSGKMKQAYEWALTLDKFKIFQLIDFSFSNNGLVKGDKVMNKLKTFIDDKKIEDFTIPYTANATNLMTGEEIVWQNGKILDAIRASISIATVFTPFKKGKIYMIDGGVVNNVPISNVKRTPGDILVVVDVNANIPVIKTKPKKKEEPEPVYMKKLKEFTHHIQKLNPLAQDDNLGFHYLIDKSISIMISKMSEIEIQKHKPDILIQMSSDTCGTLDFHKSQNVVEVGRIIGKNAIDNYWVKQKMK